MVAERLRKLRERMKETGIDMYYVPTSDFHHSEYVGSYFQSREYISGFKGSAGYVLISQNEARLWTDARYFIIAAKAIANNEFELMKMAEPGVPTMEEYLKESLKEGQTLGFDGRVVGYKEYLHLKKELPGINFKIDVDLIHDIWDNCPALSDKKAYFLSEPYSGKSTLDKLNDIREVMKKQNCDFHLVSTLDDLAWIFNMRGDDVPSCPVVLSYGLITLDDAVLYVDETKLSDELKENFKKAKVKVLPYNQIYTDLTQLPVEKKLLLDDAIANTLLVTNVSCEKVSAPVPSTLMKAIKNPVEIENTRTAHLMDGVAVTKFMIWLKDEIKKRPISEIEASDKIKAFREEWPDLIELSFGSIVGYGPNGASMHYAPTLEDHAICVAKDFLLVDSGGTYKQGTTDITRTYMLGETCHRFKENYTTVLKAMIDLAKAKYPYGATGASLDILCREPFWEKGLDFKHGTGHGVGHVLNVHEGPNNFFWRSNPAKPATVIEEGMITTDEPGYYEEGSHGIRLENELLAVKGIKTEYGQFMEFETLTLSPLDLDPVLVDELTLSEKAWLNAYHAHVYEKISPYLDEYEQAKLKEYTRAI